MKRTMESKSEQGVSSLIIIFFVAILQRFLYLIFSYFLPHNILVAFLVAKSFSDLDNPDCLDFRASRNKNLK